MTADASADQSLAPRKLITHGYVLAAADMRGTGASFGTWTECSDPTASSDGFDINEWIAAQPWCDGNVGMTGLSYHGSTPWDVASTGNPHLKTIVPNSGVHNLWGLVFYRGRNDWRWWFFVPGSH